MSIVHLLLSIGGGVMYLIADIHLATLVRWWDPSTKKAIRAQLFFLCWFFAWSSMQIAIYWKGHTLFPGRYWSRCRINECAARSSNLASGHSHIPNSDLLMMKAIFDSYLEAHLNKKSNRRHVYSHFTTKSEDEIS